MAYKNLPVYNGENDRCYNCEKRFEKGEIIAVDSRSKKVFCCDNNFSLSSCAIAHCAKTGEFVMGISMRFGETEKPPYELPDEPLQKISLLNPQPNRWKFEDIMRRIFGDENKK